MVIEEISWAYFGCRAAFPHIERTPGNVTSAWCPDGHRPIHDSVAGNSKFYLTYRVVKRVVGSMITHFFKYFHYIQYFFFFETNISIALKWLWMI